MDEYRKVKIYHLDTFRMKINQLKVNEKENLLEYYDKYILQEEKAEINVLKRIIYTLMKNYRELGYEDKSKEYYNLYQDFKNGILTYNEVIDKFSKISKNKKYNDG